MSTHGDDQYNRTTPHPPQLPNPRVRVTLGGKGQGMGVLVAYVAFSTLLSLQAPEYALIFFIYAAIPAALIGSVVGWLLGLVLRQVRNQWLHVAAFFVVGTLICAPFGGLSSLGTVLFSLSIATAAAIGRLSAWRLVKICPPTA